VFERFYRGAASRTGAAGTGLGLSVVESLAKRWEGSVTLEERPEGGTRAELRLPLHAAAAQPSPDPHLDDALPRQG
jgi:signal transduction histidine kinase